jgi:hypothetical protein
MTTSTTVSRRQTLAGVAAAAAMVPGAAAVLGVGYSASLDALLAPYDIETKRIIHKVVDDVLSLIPPPQGDALDRHDRVADPSADPVFAAIEKHRQAVQAWLAEDDETLSAQLLAAERDTWVEWLETQPTTMAGVIATMEHASHRPYDSSEYANLTESTQYSSDVLDAGEAFPAMIAEALRKIAGLPIGLARPPQAGC